METESLFGACGRIIKITLFGAPLRSDSAGAVDVNKPDTDLGRIKL